MDGFAIRTGIVGVDGVFPSQASAQLGCWSVDSTENGGDSTARVGHVLACVRCENQMAAQFGRNTVQ